MNNEIYKNQTKLNAEIKFIWSPSRVGIEGNELVEQIAMGTIQSNEMQHPIKPD